MRRFVLHALHFIRFTSHLFLYMLHVSLHFIFHTRCFTLHVALYTSHVAFLHYPFASFSFIILSAFLVSCTFLSLQFLRILFEFPRGCCFYLVFFFPPCTAAFSIHVSRKRFVILGILTFSSLISLFLYSFFSLSFFFSFL